MRRTIALFLFLFPTVLLASRYETVPDDGIPWEFHTPERIVAVGDVHADPRMLISILKNRKLIDADGHWVGGNAHLVLMGDLVDRGTDSRSVLDLAMRLESEAQAAGGNVHALLGNHDAYVAEGKLKYAKVAEMEGYKDFQNSPTAKRLMPTSRRCRRAFRRPFSATPLTRPSCVAATP